jgi:hypothetical protein
LDLQFESGVKKIHILLAEQFMPGPVNKPIADHISGIAQNHNKTNLRWVMASKDEQNQ